MDTNPFSTSPNQPQQEQPTPMAPRTPFSPMSGVNNVVKALMDGNDAYKEQQAKAGGGPGAGYGWMGNSSVGGAPLSGQPGVAPAPSVDPSVMQGAAPMAAQAAFSPQSPMAPSPMAPNPMTPPMGASMGEPTVPPVGMDPVSQALMSQIPGQ